MEIIDIKKEMFRKWLIETQPTFDSYFDWAHCPIAMYLNFLYGTQDYYRVGCTGYVRTLEKTVGVLPKWAIDFIDKIDTADISKTNTETKESLTLEEVLDVLKTVA